MDRTFLILFLIIALGFFIVSAPLLHHNVLNPLFEEDDNYYYYSVLTQTIANNGIITSNYANAFGLGVNNYPEHPGLIMFPYYVYILLHPIFNITPAQSMYLLQLLYDLIFIISVFLISYKLSNKNVKVAVLSSLFLITMLAFFYRATIIEWRGEDLIAPLSILVLYFIYSFIDNKSLKNKLFDLIAILIISFIAVYYWSGGIYIPFEIAFIFISYIIYKLSKNKSYLSLLIFFSLIFILSFIIYPYLKQYLSLFYVINGQIAELGHPNLIIVFEYFGLTWIFAGFYLLKSLILMKKRSLENEKLFVISFSAFVLSLILFIMAIRFAVFVAGFVAIYTALYFSNNFEKKILSLIVVLLVSLIFVNMYPIGNNLNIGYKQALEYIENNTPSNSIIFAQFQDESYIVALTHRYAPDTSVQNMGVLFNSTAKFYMVRVNSSFSRSFVSFLINESKGRPLYIFVRYYYKDLEVGDINIAGIKNFTTYNGTTLSALLNGTFNKTYPEFKEVFKNNDSVIWKYD